MSALRGPSEFLGKTLTVEIESLAYGGAGIARVPSENSETRGLVLFIDFVIPGEKVKVEVTECKSRWGRAKLLEVIDPSPFRVQPECSYFTVCGGCQLQHLEYHEQTKQKSRMLEEAFRSQLPEALFSEMGKDDKGRVESAVFKFVPSPKTYGYRNRIVLKQQASGLGYFKKGSHEFLKIDRCPIFEGSLSQTEVPKALRSEPEVEAYVAACIEAERADSYGVRGDSFEEGIENSVARKTEFRRPYEGFTQVNSEVNDLMVNFVVEQARVLSSNARFSRVFDLFGGAGNLGFAVVEQLVSPKPALWVVESSSHSVNQAKKRGAHLSPAVFRAFHSSVDHFLTRQSFSREDLVILDPPRGGAGPAVVESLAFGPPKAVIWVGCDLMTLLRDLKDLVARAPGAWRLQSVVGFDMFPQTGHFETVVSLASSSFTDSL